MKEWAMPMNMDIEEASFLACLLYSFLYLTASFSSVNPHVVEDNCRKGIRIALKPYVIDHPVAFSSASGQV